LWKQGDPPPVPPRVIVPEWKPTSGDRVRLYVLSLDPGVTSGWAALRVEWVVLREVGFRAAVLGADVDFAWSCGELVGPEPYQAELFLGLARGLWLEGEFGEGSSSDLFLIVVEDFVLRVFSSDRDLLSPVRVTSCLEALSWRTLLPPVVLFSAADALSVMPDHRLRALHLLCEGGEDHVRDATRHAVLGARRMCEHGFADMQLSRMSWLNSEQPSHKLLSQHL
jgi:hypothetical protein